MFIFSKNKNLTWIKLLIITSYSPKIGTFYQIKIITMMKNYGESVEISHKPNWPYIPHQPYKILVISSSGSGKANVLLNLIKHQRPDINKIYLYVKDPLESKCQLLINEREKVGIQNLKNPKAFIDYSQTIDDNYKNLEDSNPIKKKRVLIVSDDMISDMESNKKIKSYCYWIAFKRKKTQYFTCFYISIWIQSI